MNTPIKVMIADDDVGIVDAIELMLQFEGYNVSSTLDGSVIPKVLNESPDVLLLDIWMSGVDGRDVCRMMKQDEATRNIPVIMISASKDIAQSAFDAGADDFIAKPFEMDDLISKIQKHAESKRAS